MIIINKSEKFLIKISSRNKKWKRLHEKEQIYAKLVQIPFCIDETLKVKEEINYLRKELGLSPK